MDLFNPMDLFDPMDLFNSACTHTADVLLIPFANWPLLALVFWGTVAGSLMTLTIAFTSNQIALTKIVDQTRAQLLAITLFRDDLGVAFGAQAALLKLVALRLWYSVPPVLAMVIPFFVVLCQLALRYESLPLLPGDHANVYLCLSDEYWESYRNTSLHPSDGLTVETEGLRDDQTRSIAWRVRSDTGTPGILRWQLDDRTIEKKLAATTAPSRLSIVNKARVVKPWWQRALHPAEASLKIDGPVECVRVDYPRARSTPVGRWDVPWWATFLVVSMVSAWVTGVFANVKF